MALPIASFVFHRKSPRHHDGRIYARNILLVSDPAWFGLHEQIGKTLCTFAVPGYSRDDAASKALAPFGTPYFDQAKSVREDRWAPHERQTLQAGGVIVDPLRFSYQFLWVNPLPLWINNDSLELLDGHGVVFNEDVTPPQVPNDEQKHESKEEPHGQNDSTGNDASDQNIEKAAPEDTPHVLRDASGRVIIPSGEDNYVQNEGSNIVLPP